MPDTPETPATIGDHLVVAHDDPDQPLVYGTVFCDCDVCASILTTAAMCEPELPIGLKFGLAQRLVIEVGALAAEGVESHHILRRFGEEADWIREVWVARDIDDCMSPGEARMMEILTEASIPLPEFNIEVDLETGDWQPAGHRRVIHDG